MIGVLDLLRRSRDECIAEAHRLRTSAAEYETKGAHARRSAAEYDAAIGELNDAIRTLGGEP